jgi:hypothetical protein
LDECDELLRNTQIIYIDNEDNEYPASYPGSFNSGITKNNFKGVRLVGKNGNSIFIPATGYVRGVYLYENYGKAYFWINSL